MVQRYLCRGEVWTDTDSNRITQQEQYLKIAPLSQICLLVIPQPSRRAGWLRMRSCASPLSASPSRLCGFFAWTLPLTAREHLVERRVEKMIGEITDRLHGYGENYVEDVPFRITGRQELRNVGSLRQAS